ncbi:hypothetical protein IHE44_0002399 [Lamprotornis superbus]|uniref:Uncharacterized protein n=1 Tax=Lamprotornis superbus TaxID=245042 RepID=A0A835NWT0_9PASS|nr:hypothetical protein IHE44_0002399 [Lamprotornis superbus]
MRGALSAWSTSWVSTQLSGNVIPQQLCLRPREEPRSVQTQRRSG